MAEDTRNLNIEPEEIEAGKTMAFVAYLVFFHSVSNGRYEKE